MSTAGIVEVWLLVQRFSQMEVAVIIGTLRWGVGLIKEQRAQGERGRGDFLGVLDGCAILLFKS